MLTSSVRRRFGSGHGLDGRLQDGPRMADVDAPRLRVLRSPITCAVNPPRCSFSSEPLRVYPTTSIRVDQRRRTSARCPAATRSRRRPERSPLALDVHGLDEPGRLRHRRVLAQVEGRTGRERLRHHPRPSPRIVTCQSSPTPTAPPAGPYGTMHICHRRFARSSSPATTANHHRYVRPIKSPVTPPRQHRRLDAGTPVTSAITRTAERPGGGCTSQRRSAGPRSVGAIRASCLRPIQLGAQHVCQPCDMLVGQ